MNHKAAEKTEVRTSHRPPVPPRVSVVIIFLNAEKYLHDAVESVFVQTVPDWELLLVDDGSSDGSTALAQSYAASRPDQVFYLDHDGHRNRGMSASRNLGIAHARGEFIALLDADDVWLPEKLAKQVAILDRHEDIGMVINPALYWHADGTREPQRMTLPDGRMSRGAWLRRILESDDNAACPSSVLIREKLARQVGGFEASFDGPFMMVEDQVMWFKTNLAAPVYHSPECLTLYRIHPASCCKATPADQHLRIRLRLYSWLTSFLQDAGSDHAGAPQLAVMARARLCSVLLNLAAQPTRDGAARPGRLGRAQASMSLALSHRRILGPGFALLTLLGGVWGRAAAAVSLHLFDRAGAAHARGGRAAEAIERSAETEVA